MLGAVPIVMLVSYEKKIRWKYGKKENNGQGEREGVCDGRYECMDGVGFLGAYQFGVLCSDDVTFSCREHCL